MGVIIVRKQPEMLPHEILKLLRKGESVQCGKCKQGIMVALGDYKKTNTFKCDKCNNQMIVN